jgi:hypothetical protein
LTLQHLERYIKQRPASIAREISLADRGLDERPRRQPTRHAWHSFADASPHYCNLHEIKRHVILKSCVLARVTERRHHAGQRGRLFRTNRQSVWAVQRFFARECVLEKSLQQVQQIERN